MPRISVIMPAFNAEKYIKQAIDSILAQTFQNFELIIVDDGSTDNTAEIVNHGQIWRIPMYYHITNHQGIVEALNHGLKTSNGEYIARHDADDWSHPERFERQLDYLENHGCGIVGSSMLLVNECGFPTNILRYPSEVTHGDLMAHCCIAHPTVMMHREVFEKSGDYDEDFNMGCCEDYDYWLRAVENFEIHNINEVLYTNRVHDKSNIGRAKRETIAAFNELARLKARIRRL